MGAKTIAGVFFLFTVLSILNASMDGLLIPDGRETLWGNLIIGQVDNIQGAGVLAMPWIAIGFVQAFWSMITWDYTYLNNDVGLIVKLVGFGWVSVLAIWALLQMVWPILSSRMGLIAVVTGGLLTAAAAAFSNLVGL